MQGKLIALDRAIAQAKFMAGPAVFTDAADATSSGATGDSNVIVKALIAGKYPGKILAQIVDAPAARAAHAAGVGAEISVSLGGTLDDPLRLATVFPHPIAGEKIGARLRAFKARAVAAVSRRRGPAPA